MTKLTPLELDERIDMVLYVMERDRKSVKQLIRDCIEAVYPDHVPPLYEKITNEGYREVTKFVQANTKELLGNTNKEETE